MTALHASFVPLDQNQFGGGQHFGSSVSRLSHGKPRASHASAAVAHTTNDRQPQAAPEKCRFEMRIAVICQLWPSVPRFWSLGPNPGIPRFSRAAAHVLLHTTTQLTTPSQHSPFLAMQTRHDFTNGMSWSALKLSYRRKAPVPSRSSSQAISRYQ